jgi:molybdenum cofactor cytidylyltransferase
MYEQSAQHLSGIGIVLLAAGASSRLGQPKQLLVINNGTLIRKSAEVALGTGCAPIVVVLGAHKEKMQAEIKDLRVAVIENDAWQEGMGTSVKAGMQALLSLSPKIKAVILLLCDQPFVSTSLLHKLVQQYQNSGKPIIASQYGETLGVPALFDQQFFSQLTALQGDEGARKIIRQHAAMVGPLSFEEGKYDIDTIEDYNILLQMKNNKP